MGIRHNLIALAAALALSCKLGLARPAWCRRGLLIAAVLPVPPLLLTSHNTVAGIAALSLLLPANWWGRLLAARLPGEDRAAYAWTIGSAARVGLLQVAGLAIGLLGLLRAPIAWALLEATVLAIPRIRDRMRTDFALARRWSAGAIGRDALALVLGGIALACCWLALIGTLAPETNGNAVRQRTPTALSFATHGCIAVDYPDLNLPAVTPIGGLIHALVLTLGTVQGAKLLNLLIGLCCAGTVAGLGCRVGGRASGPAAISFFTMPPVVVQSQADLLDSFLTLYVVATALAILVPQRPHWRGELREGGCIGLALTVKAHFGEVAIGLATVLRGRGRRVMALVLVLTLTAGAIAARWLLRTYLVAGELPGRTLPAQALRRRKRSPSKCWRGTATRARCPMPCSGRSPRPSSVSSTASYPRPGAVRQLHQLLPAGRHPIARAGRIALAHAGHAGRGAPGARRMVVRGPVSALRLALPRTPQRGGHGGNGGRGTVAHHSRAAPGLRRPASPDHRGERRGANARAEYSYRHAVPAGDGNGTFLYCLVQ